MTRGKAGVLALILGGHAWLYFWHWYLPAKTPAALSTPVSVTVAVVQIKPTAVVRSSPKAEGQTSTTNRRSEANAPARADDSASVGSAALDTAPAWVAPLQLNLPRDSRAAAAIDSPAQIALQDPRSNTPKPTRSERFEITMGSYACVFTERQPDGSIYRGPGVWDIVPNSDVTATGGILDSRGPARVCRRKPT